MRCYTDAFKPGTKSDELLCRKGVADHRPALSRDVAGAFRLPQATSCQRASSPASSRNVLPPPRLAAPIPLAALSKDGKDELDVQLGSTILCRRNRATFAILRSSPAINRAPHWHKQHLLLPMITRVTSAGRAFLLVADEASGILANVCRLYWGLAIPLERGPNYPPSSS